MSYGVVTCCNARFERRVADNVENTSVTDDNGETRNYKGDNEEEFFGRMSVRIWKNGAGSNAGVQTKFPPLSEPSSNEGAKPEYPGTGNHQAQVLLLV
jgi:hypothetical protein